jgi:hypothetical protein
MKNVFVQSNTTISYLFNPLNTKLNPICRLLALLGAHHILHISGLRVNLLATSFRHQAIFTLTQVTCSAH